MLGLQDAKDSTESFALISLLYLERAEEFLRNPPPSDWDGVYEMKSK